MERWQEFATWQDLLGELIANGRERQRLSAATQVQSITLVRWANRISVPQKFNIVNLLKALPPKVAPTFLALAITDFPELARESLPLASGTAQPGDIPSAFYAQILEASTKLAPPLRRQTILDLLFQQALAHLDPERRGISISLATCVRPLDGRVVRSLREVGGVGTPPWKRHLEHQTLLLGAESLAGYALSQCRVIVVPNRSSSFLVPAHWTEHEQSAVAAPIVYQGRICGCLLVASALPNTFQHGQPVIQLIERYAHLASFLFDATDSYDPEALRLGFMPPYEIQYPYICQVNRLVVQQLRLAQVRGEYRSLDQAQHQIWQEIEEALLRDAWQAGKTMRNEHEETEQEQKTYG